MHGGQAPFLLQVPRHRLAKMRTNEVHAMCKLSRDRLCAVLWTSLQATMRKWPGVLIQHLEGLGDTDPEGRHLATRTPMQKSMLGAPKPRCNQPFAIVHLEPSI